MRIHWSRREMLLMLAVTAWSIPTTLGCDFACDRYQYCDESNNSCRNCSELCAKDEYTCYHKCQVHLFNSFTKRISTLESSIAIFKILLCVVVLLFGFLLVGLCVRYRNAIRECCRWRPQSKKGPPAPVGYTHENPNTKSPKAMPKNGANVTKPASTTVSIYPETEADNSVQTGTTSISHRYPAEDSTESYSYDNAACNVTPTSNNPMPKY